VGERIPAWGVQPGSLRRTVGQQQGCSLMRTPDSRSRNPLRDCHHTTYTAVAPDPVLSVRMCGTRPLYGPRLVRKFIAHELQTSRSASCHAGHSQIVAQVGSQRQAEHGPNTADLLADHTAGHGRTRQRSTGRAAWGRTRAVMPMCDSGTLRRLTAVPSVQCPVRRTIPSRRLACRCIRQLGDRPE
jgi:hypothetical protein